MDINQEVQESFLRSDQNLIDRRNVLLKNKATKNKQSDVYFSEKYTYAGSSYCLIISNKDPNIFFLIDEDDFDYIDKFKWKLKKKNGESILVTKIKKTSSNENEDFELRQVLYGGAIKKNTSSMYTGFLNFEKKDNRLSNLVNIRTNAIQRREFTGNYDTSIYYHFSVNIRKSSKNETGTRKHQGSQKKHFTRRMCPSAEQLEPLEKWGNKNLYSEKIEYQQSSYRVGVCLNSECNRGKEYTFSEFKTIDDKVVRFLIDEDDFHNVIKLNWTPFSKSQAPYIRSQNKTKISLHDFVTCRFLNEFKTNKFEDFTIDHINRIRSDNRLNNLRLASLSAQAINSGSKPMDEEQCRLKDEYDNILKLGETVAYKTYNRGSSTELSLKEISDLLMEWRTDFQNFQAD